MNWEVRQGDCREVMAMLDAASVDAIVTDPPYGLAFMGKEWDHGVPGVPFWTEALRVARPGAHLVAFGGTRTYHRLVCAIEDAGWEIRDCLMWLYGSGFPKSLDVSKAIDKAAGEYVAGAVLPSSRKTGPSSTGIATTFREKTAANPATEAAREWAGWGTALKPAWEPIILARKPPVGTVAVNVLEYGSGALNVDGCRVDIPNGDSSGYWPSDHPGASQGEPGYGGGFSTGGKRNDAGRWPANLVLDEEAAALLDAQSGERNGPGGPARSGSASAWPGGSIQGTIYPGETGGASRFFYTAKASSGERHYAGKNTHPTVKPVDLMRWLVRLVTPPGGLVLDPFTGSGSTGVAALAEGMRFLGIELDPEHVATARRRIAGPLFAEAGA